MRPTRNGVVDLNGRQNASRKLELVLDTYDTKIYHGCSRKISTRACMVVGRQILVLKVGV